MATTEMFARERPRMFTSTIGRLGRAVSMTAARLTAALLPICVLSSGVATAADAVPPEAAAAGYLVETLASNSFNSQNVDLKLTYAPGYQWYYFNYYGATPSSALTTLNSDGSVTLASTTPNPGINGSWLMSAARVSGSPGYRGTAYGGGAYFEATFSFNASTVNISQGWPLWWSMSLEHFNNTDQWTGQPSGYEHYIEPDFFEYDLGASKAAFGGEIHEWYGQWNKTCRGYCDYDLSNSAMIRQVPPNTNFSTFHRYGLLWIPATATKKGSLTYYFDHVQVGPSTTYTKFTNQAPPPGPGTPWSFGVIDNQHMVLIIGTCPPTPIHIKQVRVWQASAANNVHN